MQFLVKRLGLSLFLLALALSTSGVALAARLDLTCKSAFIRFQTRFEFEGFAGKFKNISKPISEKDILRDWLTAKIPSSLQDAKFFEVLNSEGTWEAEGWLLQILQYEYLVDGKSRKLFGVKLQHPDRDYAEHRHWVVDAVLSEIEEGKPSFSIKLRTIESIDQIMKKPQFSVPAFVSQLIQLGEASSGFLPLHYDYLEVSRAKIDRFIEALEDPQRELPIIFVSKTLQNEWLVSPSELSKRFVGRAIVMAEALNNETGSFVLVDQLKEKMPKELLAFGGAIRIYRPRVKTQSIEDRSRHPYVTPETIAARSSWELLNILEAQLERSGVTFVPNAIEKIEDIENLRRNLLLSTLDQTDPKKIEELSANYKSLQDENQGLLAEIAGQKKQMEGVDAVLEELQEEHSAETAKLKEEHSAETARLKSEIEALRIKIRQAQAGKADEFRFEVDSPQSLRAMLEKLEASLSDRIEFSRNAHTSALRHFEKREDLIPEIAKLIRAMNDHLWPILFSDPNGPVVRGTPTEIFRRASGGLEISFRESQLTRNMQNFSATRNVTHNSNLYVGEAHVKWRKGKDFIRVHFDHDPKLKKIILTHIVDHLPVSTSKKSGGRR